MSSSNVETRILQMKWDARDFESAAKNTLKLLDEVKNHVVELNQSMSNGLGDVVSGISKKATGHELDGLNEAAQKVSKNFTLMGRIAYKALDQIAEKTLDVAKKIGSDLFIKPITSGFDEYGLLMDSTQVIIANTGRSLEDVDSALEQLNKYADKTIYNFSHMTSAIGKFSAAGVGLEDSVAAIEGLSNLSALVGASAQNNSVAMEAVSRALASGRLTRQQWISFRAAGSLAGKTTKDAFIEAAKELGIFDQSWANGTGKSLSGADILAMIEDGRFEETLSYGWLTSDVLMKGLAKFSDETTELGQRAAKAATEVRTFKKMCDALVEAAQSSWSESFKYIFGNYEEGTAFWTAVNDEVSTYIGLIGDARNAALRLWHDNGGREALLSGLSTLYQKVKAEATSIFKSLSASIGSELFGRNWNQVMNPLGAGSGLIAMSKHFKAWAENLTFSEKRLDTIGRTLRLIVYSPLKEIKKFVDRGGVKAILDRTIDKLGIILNLASSLQLAIYNVFERWDSNMQDWVEGDLGIGTLLAKYERAVAEIFNYIEKETSDYSYVEGQAGEWQRIFENVLVPVQKISETLYNVQFADLVAIGTDLYDIVTSISGTISQAIATVSSDQTTTWLANAVHEARTVLDDVKAYVESAEGQDRLVRIWTGVLSAARLVFDTLYQIITSIFPSLKEGTGNVATDMLDILASVGDWFTNLERVVSQYELVKGAMEVIKAFFAPFVGFLERTLESTKGLIESIFGFSFDDFLTPAVWEQTEEGATAVERFAISFNNNLDSTIQKVSEFSNKVVMYLDVVKRTFFFLADIINKENWIGSWLRAFGRLFDLFKNADYSPIMNILTDVADIIGTVGTAFNQALRNVFKFDSETNIITETIKFFADAIHRLHGALTSDFAFTVMKRGLGSIISLFRIVYDAWAQFIGAINESGYVDAFYNAITPFAKLLGGLITYLGDLLRWTEQIIRKDELIKKFFLVVAEAAKKVFKVIETIGTIITDLISKMTGANLSVGNFFSRVFGPPRKHIEALGNTFSNGLDWLYSKLTGTAEKSKDAIEDATDGTAPLIEEQKSVVDRVVDGILKAYDDLKKGLGGVKDWLKAQWTSLFGEDSTANVSKWVSDTWNNIKSVFTVESEDDKDTEKKLTERVAGWFKGMGEKIKNYRVGNTWTSIKQWLFGELDENGEKTENVGIVGSITSWIVSIFTGARDQVVGALKGFWSGLVTTIFGEDSEEGAEKAVEKEGDKKSLPQRIGEWFGKVIDDIKKELEKWGDKLAPVKAAFDKIVEFFKPLFVQLRMIWEGGVNTLGDYFADKHGEITMKSIVDRIKGFILMFGELQIFQFVGSIGDMFDGIGKLFTKASKRIRKLSNGLNGIFESTAEGIKDVTKGAKGMFGKIGGSFKELAAAAKTFGDKLNKSLDKFLNGTLEKLTKQWTKAFKPAIKGFGKFMKDTGKGIKRYLTGKAVNEVAEGLLKFSIAVGVLAIALYGLAQIPNDQLKKGGLILGAIMLALLAVAAAIIMLKKDEKSDNPLEGASEVLKGFSGGVSILKDNVSELVEGFQKALEKFAKIGMIIAFIGAVKVAIDGIVRIGTLDPEQAFVGIVGMIVALGAVTLAMVALFDAADKRTFKVRQLLAMLTMILVIKTAVNSVLTISGMSWEEMAKGVLGMSVLMIALSVTMSLIFGAVKTLPGESGMSLRQVLGMLAICLAIHTIGNAVAKIGELPTDKILVASGVVAGLMIVFGAITTWIMRTADKTDAGITDLLSLVTMCLTVWTIGNAVKKIAQLDWKDSVRAGVIIGGIMGLFGLIMKIANEMKTTGIAAIAVLTVAVGALTYGLGIMAEDFSDEKTKRYETIATSISKVLLTFSAVLGVVAFVGKTTNLTAVLEGLASLGIVAGVVAAVIVALTAVNELINWIGRKFGKGNVGDAFLDSITNFCTKIGEAIGGFIGGIVGQIGTTAAKHLESVGKSLTTFVKNAKPFLAFVGDSKKLKDVTKGIESLAGAMLKLVAGDLLNKLNIFKSKNDNPFSKFAQMLKQIGPAFSDFGKTIEGVDTDKSSKAISAMAQFIEAASNIPNQGGKIAEIFGDNTLTDFAKGLEDFTPKFGGFLKEMDKAGLSGKNYKEVDNAIKFAGDVAEFAKKIPNQGGKIANIFGDNTLSDFAKGLEDFTPKFGGFLTAMKEQGLTEGDNSAKVQTAIDFANKVVEFARAIPNEGLSVASVIFGDNSLATFAEDLTEFTPALGGFFDAMKLQGFDKEGAVQQVQKALDFANAIVDFANKINPITEVSIGPIDLFSNNTLSLFANGLRRFTPAFSKFLKKMKNFNYGENGEENISTAIGFANDIVDFTNGLHETTKLKLGPIEIYKGNGLSTMAKGLAEFTPSFVTFLESMSGVSYSAPKVAMALLFADAAARLAEKAPRFGGLKEFTEGYMNLPEFGRQIAKFAPDFKTYLETVGSASYDASVVEKSNVLMESLAGIAGTVEGQASVLKKFFVGDDSVGGIGEGLAIFAAAMVDYSTALEDVNWDNADKVTDFLNNLADMSSKATELYTTFRLPLGELVTELQSLLTQLSPQITEEFDKMVKDKEFEKAVDGAGAHIASTFTGGIQNGFNGSIFDVTGAIEKHIRVWLETEETNVTNKLKAIVSQVASEFITASNSSIGIIETNVGSSITTSIANMMNDGLSTINRRYDDFYTVASNCMQGLINGIIDRENEVYTELDNLAAAMVATTQNGVQVRSPSRIFAWIGGNLPLGLAKGVKDKAPAALTALKEKLVRPINNMAALLNGDLEYSPKIRPVVELDGARASVNNLNSMFGSETLRMAESTIRVTNDNALAKIAKNKTYNDRNVLRAINGLQGDVVNLNSAIRNMGIYLDDNTLVGGIVDKVDKKLGSNQVRRRRFA